ncbi:hypothetical protein EW146_g6011 [Bondarzewia mesenterica]|uniref:Thioredoxin-like fold domain-containing protein n=1 Tax=Bondarzewia mesenterica TaxID=1095465 RepID=A0A4S4LPT9_9AGAM|nr:hypothetical protein EW146_g6011 [Bondarzewia mesenterica]
MALQPSLSPLIVAGILPAPHTLDIFLDYVCPFSAKMASTIDTILKPLLDEGGQYYGKVKVIVRLQVQPWHASSTLTHEAGLAVIRAAAEQFWPFSILLFQNQTDYFDVPTSEMTPIQIRDKLAILASQVLTNDEVKTFRDLLKLKGSANGGVAVTDDLKYNIKFARQNSVHVSPTVLWNGLVASQISSSWGEQEWTNFLAENVGNS